MRYSAPPNPRVADDTAAHIMEMIRAGKFAVGDRLPGERPLAGQLGVSRTSVRSALGQLIALGLLETRTGLGTYVRSPGGEAIQATLVSNMFADGDTLAHLFDLRELIEVEAAARAARRASPVDVATLRECVDQIRVSVAHNDRDALVQADIAFHRQLVAAAGNPILVDVMDSLHSLLRDMRYASTRTMELLPGQRDLLDAIERHDEEGARRAMRAHLERVRRKAAPAESTHL